MTMDNQGIVNYIRGLVTLRNRLPYEQIGKLLANILTPAFNSKEYEEYIAHRTRGIYVKPNEPVKTYSPYWNEKNTLDYIPRRQAQQKTIKLLKEKPIIFLSCDGGLYHKTNNINPANVIRQSAIIQAPLLTKPVIESKYFYVEPEILEIGRAHV